MTTGVSVFYADSLTKFILIMKKFILFFTLAVTSLTSYAQKFEIAGTFYYLPKPIAFLAN